MDTLKTAVIVVLLLAVVYGAYVVLSKPDAPLPQEIAWHDQKSSEPLQIDMGKSDQHSPSSSVENSTSKMDSMWSSDKKANEPKPLNSATSTADKSAVETTEVPKPSAAGFGFPATPANLLSDKPVADRSGSEAGALGSVAAPNLLGSGPSLGSRNEGNLGDSKTGTSSGLPSLPELRSTSNDSKFPSDLSDAPSSGDGTLPKATDPSQPGSGTTAAPGTPDPSLGPISENSSASNSAQAVTTSAVYDAALREAQWQMDESKWQSVLFTLSKFIHSPDLNADQQRKLYDLLDPLAAKVIYSAEHLVEPAYEVRRGDRLADIAQTYQIPWELLANINGIENPDLLVPGTKLKILRGPFRADVNLHANELTLFTGQLYAGRFPISVGTDPAPKLGEYQILEKQTGRVYYAGDGRTIPADDSTNPYGRVWLGLGSELSIHSSPDGGDSSGMGCISLSPLDASDVYSILSQGSPVVIRR